MIILKILHYPKEIIRYMDKTFFSRMFILALFIITKKMDTNQMTFKTVLLLVGCPLCPPLLLVEAELLGCRGNKNSLRCPQEDEDCGKLY